ncbi:cytochrome P450 [Endogone sp. FLAS-F59071]|nr:cytochrome P450 [Endogone sp. FLAS-F59071]|eukprot:RUS19009.1 cytochrome P450 [Endogone sp. FLAS-F59071]
MTTVGPAFPMADSLSNISSSLANFHNVPTSTIITSATCLFAAYFILVRIFEIDKPAGWRKIPSVSWTLLKATAARMPRDRQYLEVLREPLDKYGIARSEIFGRNAIHIGSPEFTRQVLTHSEDFPKVDLNAILPYSAVSEFFGTNVVFSSGDIWKRHRRIANPAFHRGWSTEMFGSVAKSLFLVIDEMIEQEQSPDAHDLAQRLTLDVLGKAVFDYDFEALKNPNGDYVTTYNRITSSSNNPLYIFLPILEVFPLTRRYQSFADVRHFNEMVDGLITARRRELKEYGVQDSTKADLVTLMIQASDEEEKTGNGKGMTDMEIKVRKSIFPLAFIEEYNCLTNLLALFQHNIAVFFSAGHDTTANAISCAIYQLAVHQDIQRKARAEILSLLSATDATEPIIPTIEETKLMPYLDNIIKETLRLSPSISQLTPRTTSRDVTMGEYVLLKGTPVFVNIFALHHSRVIWGDDVDEFKPERFENRNQKMSDANAEVAHGENMDRYTWMPFSTGPRACLGMTFSNIEQRVTLSMLHASCKDGLQFAFSGGAILHAMGIKVQFKRRM